MNIYDQLLKLQIIDTAWEDWRTYRSDLTSYLMTHIRDKSSLTIFGAGRCNDFDLKCLLNDFERLILVDVDLEGMREALKKQNLENEARITLEVADFVGISANDYRYFADTLVYTIRQKGLATSVEELTSVALEELEKLSQKALDTALSFKSYENIVVIGVHSQLISMLDWIWQAILQTLNQEETSVREYIIQMNTTFITRFNRALLKSVQGQIVVGYEIIRQGRAGTIQGALQAAIDFKERVDHDEISVSDFTQLAWPFDKRQGIIYQMGIFTAEKR